MDLSDVELNITVDLAHAQVSLADIASRSPKLIAALEVGACRADEPMLMRVQGEPYAYVQLEQDECGELQARVISVIGSAAQIDKHTSLRERMAQVMQ